MFQNLCGIEKKYQLICYVQVFSIDTIDTCFSLKIESQKYFFDWKNIYLWPVTTDLTLVNVI